MKNGVAALAVCLYLMTLILAVNAETTTSPTPTPYSQTPSLIGTIIAATGVILIFAFIAFAGYKVVKKWSASQPD